MRALSLFTGAGGLDVGCEIAGFSTVAAVESNVMCRETIRANAGVHLRGLGSNALFDDVASMRVEDLLSAADIDKGEAALVHGGPPCTPFSKSGYWLEYKRAGSDPKASLLDHFVAVVREAQPMSFLMENVYGLAYRNQNRPVFERFQAGIRSAGYSLDYRVLLAADYGVPQLRQRLVCVGVRQDLLDRSPLTWRFSWPEAQFSGPHETRKGWDLELPAHKTAGEALSDLSDVLNPPEPEELVSGTFAEELEAVPPGENYLWWTAKRGHPEPRFEWRSRFWSFLLKLSPDRPAPTIQGQPGPWVGPFHWDNRRLRIGELKRLMTFPDDYIVVGSRRDQQLQLGNAVPPLLAAQIANALREELDRLGAVHPALPVAA